MPFKSVDRRREFDRSRKAKRRAELKKIDALAGVRLYYCQKFPSLYISGAGSFFQGFLIVTDRQEQARVEEHELFWVNIFPIQLDLSCLPEVLPE
jgi:hypothetical protein